MSFQMSTRPDRIFVSVDESTGRSTISFSPPAASAPILHDDDAKGSAAMRDAKAISDKYPGCTIHGPHFHAARPPGKKRFARKASAAGSDE
jgi:hypothetical protein